MYVFGYEPVAVYVEPPIFKTEYRVEASDLKGKKAIERIATARTYIYL